MKPLVNWKNHFYKPLVVFFSLFFSLQILGQGLGSDFNQLTVFFQALNYFSKNIPQEKAYLHFDNTSYYQSDHIWFKCYVVTSQHQLSQLSKTLYVELLNPGGEIVDKRILKIENGQCHGDFSLNQLPFYSGFYEIRAYTKYMLNFGDDVIFSRLLPVFDKPKEAGNFEEKKMLGYGRYGPLGSHTMKRERPLKGNTVNLRFFPEGGNLVRGITSQVAFEATDEVGNPIDITGIVMDAARQELSQISTLHEGRGVFSYTPSAIVGRRRDIVEVEYSGRKYKFDAPESLPQGVVMEVDNLAYPDSIGITLRKNMNTPAELLGVAVLNGGKLQNYCCVSITDDAISFKMDKARLPSGVSQIVLFNSTGEILCDRLVFAARNDLLDIKATTNKQVYRPHELVEMELSVADQRGYPDFATFSLSVRDGANEVENNHNIMTDLLLMSEIKGYVRNPFYYFESEDKTHRSALDVLLMVQGWRRYSWKQMAGMEPFAIKYLPEQGIETHGSIVSLVRQKPQPNVDVGLLLHQRGEEDTQPGGSFVESFVTDEQGRFSFVSDISGKWSMILTVKEKGKKKDHRILLDRVFSPDPKRYRYAEMQVRIAEKNSGNMEKEETPDNFEYDLDLFLKAYNDSLAKLGMDEKVYHLKEVTVQAKRRTKEQDIFHNRSTSVAFYDVASEYDDIYDRGGFAGNNIHERLKNMNKDFSIRHGGRGYDFLLYKGRMMVFVVNYEKTTWDDLGYFKYRNINLSAIKSIYINENTSVIAQYIFSPNPNLSPLEVADRLGCAVFIETYPEGNIPVEGEKGVRKTWLEGYSVVQEFYSPDYSSFPPEPNDYRRTLYWNPSVIPDENGFARIRFYNNSSCKNFSISAETFTPQGMIGIYKDK